MTPTELLKQYGRKVSCFSNFTHGALLKNSGRLWSRRVHPAVSPRLMSWIFSTRIGFSTPARSLPIVIGQSEVALSFFGTFRDGRRQPTNNVCLSQPGFEPQNFRQVARWCHQLNHREALASYENMTWVRRTALKNIQYRCFRLTLSYVISQLTSRQ